MGGVRLKAGDVSRSVHDLERENDIMSLLGASLELRLDEKSTGLVHPGGVCRDAGEDGGLLVRVAPQARDKASYAMDIVMVVDDAAERASKVTLEGSDIRR